MAVSRSRFVVLVLLVSLVAAAMATAPSSAAGASASRLTVESFTPEAIPGEYIVALKRGAERAQGRLDALGAAVLARPTRNTFVVRAAAARDAAALAADPAVAFVEPNYVRHLAEVIPNDPSFSQQWGFKNTAQAHGFSGGGAATIEGIEDADMNITDAWDTTQGDAGTVVAILDSGVDTTHPDLAANLWVNAGEIPGNNRDDDGNGYADDVHGYDFAENDDTLLEPNPAYVGFDHGTHVAGTVAAVAGNGTGVAGVCPGCRIMVLKIFKPVDTDQDGVKDTMIGEIAAGIEAIQYAIDMGADIVNGSLGAALSWSKAERRSAQEAEAAGITMVFAAGNENGDNDLLVIHDFDGDDVPDSLSPSYPASYDVPGIISVAASNHNDENGYSSACQIFTGSAQWPCTFTNWGRTSVDVSAPGVDVISTVPGGYDFFDGTSMATPHVAGLAGLIKSAHPEYTPVQVKNAIMNSAKRSAGLSSLLFFPRAPQTGTFTVTAGRADAAAALTAATSNATPSHDGSITGATSISSSRTGSVTWPVDANDVYKKRLTKGVRYRVKLNGPDDGTDLDLAIYKPGITEIWQVESGCMGGPGGCKILHYSPLSGADEAARFKARRTGTYYFQVAAYLLQGGNYTLKVTRL